MAEFTNANLQVVQPNQPVVYNETPDTCNNGCITHREGAGVIRLSGPVRPAVARGRQSIWCCSEPILPFPLAAQLAQSPSPFRLMGSRCPLRLAQ